VLSCEQLLVALIVVGVGLNVLVEVLLGYEVFEW